MADVVHLFGYGSLVATPELKDAVLGMTLGRLAGYSRLFNKRSPVRGCPKRDAFDEFATEVPENFRRGDINHSLAVGIQLDPSGHTYGGLVSYAANSEAELLKITDAREGYDPSADSARLGYLRDRLEVRRPRTGDDVMAWVYLSNPGGSYHLHTDVGLATRAKILISATPRPNTPTAWTGRALGLLYLEQIRAWLREWNVRDPAMEQMAAAVHQIPGPWVKLVVEPID